VLGSESFCWTILKLSLGVLESSASPILVGLWKSLAGQTQPKLSTFGTDLMHEDEHF